MRRPGVTKQTATAGDERNRPAARRRDRKRGVPEKRDDTAAYEVGVITNPMLVRERKPNFPHYACKRRNSHDPWHSELFARHSKHAPCEHFAENASTRS